MTVLVFTRTTDYRHDSIPHAVDVVRELLGEAGYDVEHTEDPASHRDLARYRLVVWLSTSGTVLGRRDRREFATWLAQGGAWAGIHSATFTEPGWDELPAIAGARFTDHPEYQPGTVRVSYAGHPSTRDLPETWVHADEWYNFDRFPADRTILLTVDEDSYEGGTMGDPHPVAWSGRYGQGRTWYTSLGHATEAYDDPSFRAHLRGGLLSLLQDRRPVGEAGAGQAAAGEAAAGDVAAAGVATAVTEPADPDVEAPDVERPHLEAPDVEAPHLEAPDVEDPDVEEPDVEEPRISEPRIAEPRIAAPRIAEPRIAEPRISEPRIGEPRLVDPDPAPTTEPETWRSAF